MINKTKNVFSSVIMSKNTSIKTFRVNLWTRKWTKVTDQNLNLFENTMKLQLVSKVN